MWGQLKLEEGNPQGAVEAVSWLGADSTVCSIYEHSTGSPLTCALSCMHLIVP